MHSNRFVAIVAFGCWSLWVSTAGSQDLQTMVNGEAGYAEQPLLEVLMNPQEPVDSRLVGDLAGDLGLGGFFEASAQGLVEELLGGHSLQVTSQGADGDWVFGPNTLFSEGAPFVGVQEYIDLREGVPTLFLASLPEAVGIATRLDLATIGIEDLDAGQGVYEVLLPTPEGDRFDVFLGPADGVLTVDNVAARTAAGTLPIVLIERTHTSRSVRPLNARTPERRGTGGVPFRRASPLGIRVPEEQVRSTGVRFSLLDAHASHLFINRPALPVLVQAPMYYDQMRSQACTAFATCFALDYTFARQYSRFAVRANPLRLMTSPQYMYYNSGIFEFGDAEDSTRCYSGRTLEGVKLWLQANGNETYYSLGNTDLRRDNMCTPPPQPTGHSQDAAFFRPEDVILFDLGDGGVDVPGMKRLLTSGPRLTGRPIVAMLPIDVDFFQTRSEIGSRKQPWAFKGRRIAFHAVTLVGFEDAHAGHPGAFLLRNSWGGDWKLDGYCWVDYRMFLGKQTRDYDFEGFVIGPLPAREREVARQFH